ncbi:MAG: BspA family leucine-rich repeat surface protein, partial [Bacteroidales bacterium]|nr:BspA family leucine-rich repeat surface protein [Bacteroidales bacterium]
MYWTQHSASSEQIGSSSASLEIATGDLGNKIYQMHWAVVKDYAYLSSDSKTLTFTHGAKPEGVNYFDLNGENTKPAWETAKTMIETVVFASTITPTSCYYWFDGFENLTTIENLENLHTENVTDMRSMFGSCKKLKKLDLRTFNTANVKYMVYMFQSCRELTVLDISSFDTQKAKGTDWWMSSMFFGCVKLTTILIGPKWDAGNANVDIFTGTQELIGNDGTVYSTTKLTYEYAHANAGGLLTTGDYKIFYQWADKPNEYQAYEPSTFNGSVDVTIPNPERDGYKFLYWTRVSPTGAYDGGSSSSLKIAAGDEGNRIYMMHWVVDVTAIADTRFRGKPSGNLDEIHVCGEEFQMSANSVVEGVTSGTWTLGDGTSAGEFIATSDSHNPSATVRNIPADGVTLKWTVTNGTDSDSDEITIYNEKPVATILDGEREFCGDGNIELQAVLNDGEVGTWSSDRTFSSTNGTDNSNLILKPIYLSDGETTFKWEVYRSGHPDCVSSTTTTIKNTYYKAEITTVAENLNICMREVKLSASNIEYYNAKGWWTSNHDDVIKYESNDNAASNSSSVVNVSELPYGETVFTWHVQKGDCPVVTS